MKCFPKWLHRTLPLKGEFTETQKALLCSSTVCEEAMCPNALECFSKKTATFLLLGKQCTRKCRFCAVAFSHNPPLPDMEEPGRVAKAAFELSLRHVVLTMVTRDDLLDGGAHHLVKTMQAVREMNPKATIEVLTSDFQGNWDALDMVLFEKPDVLNHNLETVRRLTPHIRNKATYERSLSFLEEAKKRSPKQVTKSGFMVGLGEEKEEVFQAILDLKNSLVDMITIGQYMQPTEKEMKVHSYIPLEMFQEYEEYARSLGVKHVISGPYVRSSYLASPLGG